MFLSVGSLIMVRMSEIWDPMQRHIAALWDAARSLGSDEPAFEQMAGLVDAVIEAEAQLAGLRLHLLHEARLSGAANVVAGVRHSVRTTSAQATASLKLSLELGERFPQIRAALSEGIVSLQQADAIVAGLKKLPGRLTRAELAQCEETVLEHVDVLGPAELRTLAAHLLEVVDPEQAEAAEAQRLAAEDRAARRGRFLSLTPDHHGSMRITGQLPVADAALLSAQLEALMPSSSSYAETGETPTPGMRRADALVLLTTAAANSGDLPAKGADRPTVHVTMTYDTLLSGLGSTGLFSAQDIDGISAGEARLLACDANVIPFVLGGDSQPLDVGRAHRTFPPGVRAAIIERDSGCAFPSCTVASAGCHAHHIVPWWAGGGSSVSNGVLLCPHHHRRVEPDPAQPPETQWQVHLDPVNGLPWFTPPKDVDPRRRPRQHTRFILRQITLKPAAQAPPCPPAEDHGVGLDEGVTLEELFARSAAIWAPHSTSGPPGARQGRT